jgi:hypothetical protein
VVTDKRTHKTVIIGSGISQEQMNSYIQCKFAMLNS